MIKIIMYDYGDRNIIKFTIYKHTIGIYLFKSKPTYNLCAYYVDVAYFYSVLCLSNICLIEMYRVAASGGLPDGMNSLALLLEEGRGYIHMHICIYVYIYVYICIMD